MTANLTAFAFAQLLHAPLADRYGRRRLLTIGLAGFVVASSVCASAPSAGVLVFGRFLQGLASSVPSVVVLLIVYEIYARDRAVRVLGLHGMAVAVAPIVGPMIGGLVFVNLGWRANFWILSILAGVAALLCRALLPETLGQPVAIRPISRAKSYLRLLRSPRYLAHLIPLTCVFGALFAFITAGPFVFINGYGVPTSRYGLYFGLVILGAVTGGLMANRLADRFQAASLVAIAYVTTLVTAAVLAIAVGVGADGPATVAGILALFAVGVGLMNASAPILLLDSTGDEPSSSGSALGGSAQLAGASASSFAVATLPGSSLEVMAIVIAAFVLTGAIGFVVRCGSE